MTASLDPEKIQEFHKNSFCLDATAPLFAPRPRVLTKLTQRMRAGGVDAVLATFASIENAHTAIAQLGAWLRLEQEGALPVRLVREASDFALAKSEGKIATVLQMQGTSPIEDDLNLINVYHALGVRVIQLTYNTRNLVGDGCMESGNSGLSDFGKKVVRRLNELRIAIDLSHVGDRTCLDAVEASTQPVILSHANSRNLCDNRRNAWDGTIKKVVETGGMVGVCAFPTFLTWTETPTLEHVLRHIDYLCELVGPEHVGLGFDFSTSDEDDFEFYGYDESVYPRPPWIYPEGIRFYEDWPNVTEGLFRRGYAEAEIRGILGENFRRVLGSIWGK